MGLIYFVPCSCKVSNFGKIQRFKHYVFTHCPCLKKSVISNKPCTFNNQCTFKKQAYKIMDISTIDPHLKHLCGMLVSFFILLATFVSLIYFCDWCHYCWKIYQRKRNTSPPNSMSPYNSKNNGTLTEEYFQELQDVIYDVNSEGTIPSDVHFESPPSYSRINSVSNQPCAFCEPPKYVYVNQL